MLMIDKPVCMKDGQAPLYGSLVLPGDNSNGDAILIWAGSGPTDRNGNAPGLNNNSIKMLAQALGGAGYAVLRTDKRGVGESQDALKDESSIRFETFVDDLCDWEKFFRKETKPNRLFLLGHSEGALVATLAAQRLEADGLILVSGMGSPPADLLRWQLSSGDVSLPLEDLDLIFKIMESLERGATVSDVPEKLMGQFRPSVQPYLISWFKYDPALELGRVSIPILVVHGTRDLQVSMGDAERLAGAKNGIQFALIPDMNHVLKNTTSYNPENYGTYNKPLLPLANGFFPAIIGFLEKI
jgi:pimeloyl-ACP methyl ester carboxylesterase